MQPIAPRQGAAIVHFQKVPMIFYGGHLNCRRMLSVRTINLSITHIFCVGLGDFSGEVPCRRCRWPNRCGLADKWTKWTPGTAS